MTPSLPVVLSGPPPRHGHPRVTVTRLRGRVNTGNGRQHRFVVRYVVDGRPRELLEAGKPATAALRAGALVRLREPHAVWVFDGDRSTGWRWIRTSHWRPLARAVGDVQAAFVVWE